jgi:hypothetical protein
MHIRQRGEREGAQRTSETEKSADEKLRLAELSEKLLPSCAGKAPIVQD